jgi:hypothetical protein
VITATRGAIVAHNRADQQGAPFFATVKQRCPFSARSYVHLSEFSYCRHNVPKRDILSPRSFLTPHFPARSSYGLRHPFAVLRTLRPTPDPQGHSVFQAPSPAAILAHLGQRGLPDGVRSSMAWTYTARLVKVGPLECPGLQALEKAIVERLERAAYRTEMADRRLNAQPPAYVQRELVETRFLPVIRDTRAVGLGVPWYGVAVAWKAVLPQACVGPHADTRLDRITSDPSQPPT